MNKIILSLLFIPIFLGACEEYEHTIGTRFAPLEISLEDIVKDFIYIKVEHRETGGTLPTTMIQRLAATEGREERTHGKDFFWRSILAQRNEEEEAQSLIERLTD